MKVIVLNARLSFCNIFQPRKLENKPGEFDATLLCLDPGQAEGALKGGTKIKVNGEVHPHSKLEEIVNEVLKEKLSN